MAYTLSDRPTQTLSAHAHPVRLCFEQAVGGELLDPMVVLICYIHRPCAVYANAGRHKELTFGVAQGRPVGDERSVRCELFYATIRVVRYVHIAKTINSDAVRVAAVLKFPLTLLVSRPSKTGRWM